MMSRSTVTSISFRGYQMVKDSRFINQWTSPNRSCTHTSVRPSSSPSLARYVMASRFGFVCKLFFPSKTSITDSIVCVTCSQRPKQNSCTSTVSCVSNMVPTVVPSVTQNLFVATSSCASQWKGTIPITIRARARFSQKE